MSTGVPIPVSTVGEGVAANPAAGIPAPEQKQQVSAAAQAAANPLVPATKASRFTPCVAFVLEHEGGYVNHPADPGGATNLGITAKTLAAWRGEAAVLPEEVRALTKAEAEAIYRANYWNPIRGDDLPRGVDLMAFNFGVNAGVSRSAKFLQECAANVSGLPLVQDGAIGPRTLAAVAACDPRKLVANLAARQAQYYRALPGFATFGKGWLNRLAEAQAEAAAALVG